MSHPILKYLIGYILRFVLGTALVLGLISAAGIILFKDALNQNSTTDPTARSVVIRQKVMQYPDKLVISLLAKYAPDLLRVNNRDADTNDTAPVISNTPLPTQTSPSTSSPAPTITKAEPTEPATPVPARIPDMPSIPDTAVSHQSAAAPHVEMPAGGEWGVTADNNTPVYNLKGKLQTHVKAGKTFGIIERKQTHKGVFLVCCLPGRTDTKFVLKPEHVITYKCDYNEISSEQRKLCVLQARLTAAIEMRKEQLKKEAENRNPYAAQYRSALHDFKKLVTRNNALRREYDNATGAHRMELTDQLRMAKDEYVRMREKFEPIKRKYKAWNASHQSNASIDYDSDSKIKLLKKRLAEVEYKLAHPQ